MAEWMAYAKLEPFGEERSDLRSGIVASTIANALTDESESFDPQDFMPDFEEQFVPLWKKQKQTVEQINKMFGGRDER